MTHEQRAGFARTLFTWTLLILAVVAAFWFFSGKKETKPEPNAVVKGLDPDAMKKAQAAANCLTVIHHFMPGNVDCEKLAKAMEHLDAQFGDDVKFHTLDAKKYPEASKQEGAKQYPHLDIFFENQKVFTHEGPMTEAELRAKLEELIRGLVKRTHKGWLPTVNGMQPNKGQSVIPIDPPDKR
ncbi:thioredoxin family protein [Luteolibacter sp. LG18]|uniref:thioredoxin family protein n=1 Tax=Luteolibacter sp. LG18 TaxID=2819286 RepID=UPI002B31F959|nr:hypothetical protein llg_12550 [Luteolibacter sp. LG18]